MLTLPLLATLSLLLLLALPILGVLDSGKCTFYKCALLIHDKHPSDQNDRRLILVLARNSTSRDWDYLFKHLF